MVHNSDVTQQSKMSHLGKLCVLSRLFLKYYRNQTARQMASLKFMPFSRYRVANHTWFQLSHDFCPVLQMSRFGTRFANGNWIYSNWATRHIRSEAFISLVRRQGNWSKIIVIIVWNQGIVQKFHQEYAFSGNLLTTKSLMHSQWRHHFILLFS